MIQSSCGLEPRSYERPDALYPILDSQSHEAVIRRDDAGVAHIEAASIHELLFAWGYVHGTDRLWQMDYLHRLGLGLSGDVYGFDAIKSDAFVQFLGIGLKADSLVGKMRREAKEDYNLLAAYAAGVNKARSEQLNELPHQFVNYDLEPLPWSPEASMVMILVQSLDMTLRTLTTDLEAAVVEKALGANRYHKIFGQAAELSSFETSIIRAEDLSPEERESGSTPSRDIPTEEGATDLSPSQGGGSNAWAIGASRTVSGGTILANDTHLSLKNPSFWHESHVRLKSGELDVYGFSVAGVPMFVGGFSRDVAWGLTLGYGNAMDIISYPLEPDGKSYRNEQGEVVRFSEVKPDLQAKVGPFYVPIFWVSREVSRDGIRIHLDLPEAEGRALVLKWTALELEALSLKGMFSALRAKSADEAQKMMAVWEVPNFNIVWADKQGGLAFRQLGLIPKRRGGKLGVVDAVSETTRWDGYLSTEEMPHLVNPARDYVVSANNTPTRDRMLGGHYLGDSFRRGYRARRIEEMIEAKPKHTFEDVVAMQLDVVVPEARIVLPKMLKAMGGVETTELESTVIDRLGTWDHRAELDSPETTIFIVWKQLMMEELFGAELASVGKIPFRTTPLRVPVDALWKLFEDEGAELAELKRALKTSLAGALAKLSEDLGLPGPTFEAWHWGLYHPMTIRALDGNSAWDLPAFPAPGTRNTVSMAKEIGMGPYEAGAAASFRLVVELGESVRAAGVLPGTSLDLPTSTHPKDVERWREGVLRQLHFYDEDIEKHSTSSQSLRW